MTRVPRDDLHPPVVPSVPASGVTAQDEVARICQDLLRIDSSNYGDGSGPGERAAAEYVMASLQEVGLEPELFESAPGRANVVVRLPGVDPSRPALVLHGHTDVVPAAAQDWSVDPFGGEEIDGMLWGRGAVDMKDMDAMMLAVVRQMVREYEAFGLKVGNSKLPRKTSKESRWRPYRKPTQVDGEKIPRRVRERPLRNSAK